MIKVLMLTWWGLAIASLAMFILFIQRWILGVGDNDVNANQSFFFLYAFIFLIGGVAMMTDAKGLDGKKKR